jgi:hypothetical protein
LRGLIQRVGGVNGTAIIRPSAAGTVIEITIPVVPRHAHDPRAATPSTMASPRV